MQERLSLRTLGELDNGSAELVINAAIRAAVADIDDRGDDGVKRQVHIIVEFKKLDNGIVATTVEAEAKVPKRRTATTLASLFVTPKGPEAVFQSYAPDDPHQRTIDEAEEQGGDQ